MTVTPWRRLLPATAGAVVAITVGQGSGALAQAAAPGEIGAAVEAAAPGAVPAEGATVVTRETFVRAETDRMFAEAQPARHAAGLEHDDAGPPPRPLRPERWLRPARDDAGRAMNAAATLEARGGRREASCRFW